MANEDSDCEGFHGVYLLLCKNPQFTGRTYVGYTVNPNRRITQHNKGKQYGGAAHTNARGPWDMILIVHGFPTSTAALRFEYAWQKPRQSRHLKAIVKNCRKRSLTYCLDLLWTMLKLPPWNRLPLVIRWLGEEHIMPTKSNLIPPPHMAIVFGKVKVKRINDGNAGGSVEKCFLCKSRIDSSSSRVQCLSPTCRKLFHMICLARAFTAQESKGFILPIEGPCPSCSVQLLWGDLIRKKSGYADDFVTE